MSLILKWFIVNIVFFVICMIPGLGLLVCNPLGLTILFVLNNIYFIRVLTDLFKPDPKKKINEQLEKSKKELKKRLNPKPKIKLAIAKAPYGKVGHISKKNCINKTGTKDCSNFGGLWYAKCKDGYSGKGVVCIPV